MDPFTQCTLIISCEVPSNKPQGNAKLRYLYRNIFSGMLGVTLIPLMPHTELSSVGPRFRELALIF